MMMIDQVVDGCVTWHTGDVNLIPSFICLKALNKQKNDVASAARFFDYVTKVKVLAKAKAETRIKAKTQAII